MVEFSAPTVLVLNGTAQRVEKAKRELTAGESGKGRGGRGREAVPHAGVPVRGARQHPVTVAASSDASVALNVFLTGLRVPAPPRGWGESCLHENGQGSQP